MGLVKHFQFYRTFGILLTFCMLASNAYAGNDGFTYGPRALGTGQISVLHSDVWSNFNNVGALGWLKQNSVGVSFENRYNQGAFNQMAFGAALPTKKLGVVGVSASKFGGDIFNQTRAQVGWAKAFGIASIGLQAQWYQFNAVNFPTQSRLLINFGGLAQLTPKIQFGASISNIGQAKASEFQDEKVPTIVKGGISFLPSKKVKLMGEIQKDLDQKAVVKAGIEYELVEKVWLRTGFTSQTLMACGGIGVEWRNLQFNYAFSHHPQLGWSNGIGLNFRFGKELEDKPKEGPKEVK